MPFLLVGTSQNVFYHHRAHKHSRFEMILNLEGSGSIKIGDETSLFYPGSVHLIPPCTMHEKNSEDGFRDIYIQLDSWNDSPHGWSPRHFLTFSDDEEKTIESLLRMMLLRYLRQKKPDAVLFTMCELIMQLSKERCEVKRIDPTVEKIVQQITLCDRMQAVEQPIHPVIAPVIPSLDHISVKIGTRVGIHRNYVAMPSASFNHDSMSTLETRKTHAQDQMVRIMPTHSRTKHGEIRFRGIREKSRLVLAMACLERLQRLSRTV